MHSDPYQTENIGTLDTVVATKDDESLIQQSENSIPLPLCDIIPSPYQPRKKKIKEKDVAELAAGIKAVGQLTPIIVSRSFEEKGKYVVHAGHRRCAALKSLGKDTVQAIVRNLSEREARRLAVCENLGREDLSCMDQADALDAYAEDYGLSVKAAGAELGISGATQKRLRLIITMPEQLQRVFREHEFSAHAAEIFARLERLRPGVGVRYAELYADKKMSLKKVRNQVDELTAATNKNKGGRPRKSSANLKMLDSGFELHIRLLTLDRTEPIFAQALDALNQCLAVLEGGSAGNLQDQNVGLNQNN